MIPTYVISFRENNSERRKNVIKQSKKHKLHFEWIDAIRIKEEDKNKYIDKKGTWLRSSQVGCALSHIECYKKIIESNQDVALILEDDFVIKKEFRSNLDKHLNEILHTKSILFLHTGTFGENKIKLKNLNDNLHSIIDSLPLCASGYIITKEACIDFIDKATPIISVADDWPRFYNMGIINHFYVYYPLPVNVRYFKSEIGYDIPDGRFKNLVHFLDKYAFVPSFIFKIKHEIDKRRNNIFNIIDD